MKMVEAKTTQLFMKAIGIKPIALLYFLAVCSTLMGRLSENS